jgi:hypothetical protein
VAYCDFAELAPYHARRDELTGCLMWGILVVIPTKLCSQVLDQIHEGHLGVVKMKSFKSCTSAKVLSFLVSICISLFDTGKFSICST